MTSTVAAPPAPRPTVASPRTDRASNGRGGEAPGPSPLLAEVALATATLTALVPFTQVFSGGLFPALALAAICSHLIAAVLRRANAPFWLVLPVLAGACVLVGTWATFGTTTRLLLPTDETVRAVVAALRESLEQANQDAAPIPADPGFVVVTFVATWLSAAVADRAAFRWWLVLQALVPAAALFTVAAVLAPREAGGRAVVGALFLVAALLFVLCQRPLVAAHRRRWTWAAEGARRGRRRQLLVGAVLVLVVGIAAAATVPSLPGGDGEGVYAWRPGDRSAPHRQTSSPLVDIRSRLVDQPATVLFTVEASQPSYWRTTALDVFDGRIWRSTGTFSGASGDLDLPDDELVGSTTVEQRFHLEEPGQIWLPAAFRPVAVDAGDVGIRHDEESATLIVDNDRESADGLTYEVTSAPPDLDAATLDAASAPPPSGVAERYLQLPTDLSPTVLDVAREVTAGAATPHQRALALEAFFLDGSFTYSLDVPAGHGASAIDEFLQRRVGYCEQFAGTYAAMARAVGLPSRVAVGYTAGRVDPDEPRRNLVRGEDAHAWPEVWLTGVGWIPMEPTPPDPTSIDDAPTTTSTTVLVPTSAPEAAAPPTVTVPESSGSEQAAPSEETGNGAWLGLPAGLLLVLSTVLILSAAAAASVPLSRRRRHHLRSNGDPVLRVESTWAMTLDDLAGAGLPVAASDTPVEVARAAGGLDLVDPRDLADLGRTVGAARWSPEGVAEADADRAADVGEAVERAVDERMSRRRRWTRHLHPRRLRRATRPRA